MLKKPVKGKKAKTISCKSAHPDEKIADADIKGASVRRTQLEMADKNITLSNLFHE